MRALYPSRIGIWSVSFCGGRKTEEPGKKPLELGRELATNSTHIWHRAGIELGPLWWEASAIPALREEKWKLSGRGRIWQKNWKMAWNWLMMRLFQCPNWDVITIVCHAFKSSALTCRKWYQSQLQKREGTYKFEASLPNPYKLSILGDIWRAIILPFSSSKYCYSCLRLSNLVDISFEYLYTSILFSQSPHAFVMFNGNSIRRKWDVHDYTFHGMKPWFATWYKWSFVSI